MAASPASLVAPLVERAVVFDFDGVLARSMELHAESYRVVLGPYGIQVKDRDIFELEGARSETILRALLQRHKVAVDKELENRLAVEKQRVFAGWPPPSLYDGAAELVRAVRQNAAKLGLVTGTRRENLHRMIPDLLPLFDAVLAQDSYTHDKPHPEPYAKAAQQLGLPARQCAALENAVWGIESARAAGYGYVVAITTTRTAKTLEAARADLVVTSPLEASTALSTWARSPPR